MNFLKKISIRHVLGNPTQKELRKFAEGKGTMLMRVFGDAERTRTGAGEYGDWIGFKGQFEAVNLFSGEVFRSGQCFLPPVVTDPLAAELNAMQGKRVDKDGKVTFENPDRKLRFAFDVGIQESTAPIGYEYTLKSLIEQETANDPLADLRKALPALEGKKTAKTA